jgi:competence protein ComEC
MIAPIISRKGCLFSALLTAALLELILKPSVIWNLGFQLSYSVVFMILKLGLPTAKLYEEKIQPYKFDPTPNWISKCRFVLKKNVFTSLILTLSAFLPSTILLHPITHMVSILSIPLNLLIVPILPVLLTLGLTIYPVSMVHPILASPLKLISDFTIKTTTQLIEIFLQIPLSHYFLSSTLPFLSKLIPLLMVLIVLFFQNPTYKWISTILLWLLYFTTEIMV